MVAFRTLNRRKSAGFALGYVFAILAVTAGALVLSTTTTQNASRQAATINNRAQLTSTINSLTNSISRDGSMHTGNIFQVKPAKKGDGRFIGDAGAGYVPGNYGSQFDPLGTPIKYCVWHNGPGTIDPPIEGDEVEPLYINSNFATHTEVATAPSFALMVAGKNGQFETNCRDITELAGNLTRLKSADAINEMLQQNRSDDRIFAKTDADTRDAQGQGAANLVAGVQTCDEIREKLIYRQNDEGQVEFACVPEHDPQMTAENVGNGTGRIFKYENDDVMDNVDESDVGDMPKAMKFRTITASGAAQITQNADTINIDVSTSSASAANSGANGARVYKDGTTSPFVFRRIISASPAITLTENDGQIVLGFDGSSSGVITGAQNIGTGPGAILKEPVGSTLGLRRIKSADTNLDISTVADDVVIKNTLQVPVKGGINVGGGLIAGVPNTPPDTTKTKSIYIGIDGNKKMVFRRLQAGNGVILSDGDGCTANNNGNPRNVDAIPANGAAANAYANPNGGAGNMAARNGGGGAPANQAMDDVVEANDATDTGNDASNITGCEKAIKISLDLGSIHIDEHDPVFLSWRNSVMPGAACAAGQVIRWDGTRFVCVSVNQTETDPVFVATRPAAACAANEVLKWNGSQFVCTSMAGLETDPVFVAARPGAVCNGVNNKLTWDGAHFTCESDQTGGGGGGGGGSPMFISAVDLIERVPGFPASLPGIFVMPSNASLLDWQSPNYYQYHVVQGDTDWKTVDVSALVPAGTKAVIINSQIWSARQNGSRRGVRVLARADAVSPTVVAANVHSDINDGENGQVLQASVPLANNGTFQFRVKSDTGDASWGWSSFNVYLVGYHGGAGGGGGGNINVAHSGSGTPLAAETGSTSNLTLKRVSGQAGVTISENAGGIVISGSGANQWSSNGNDLFYNTGNVGLGTNAPRRKLDARGDVVAYTDSSTFTMLHSGSAIIYPQSNSLGLRFGTVSDVPSAGGYPNWSEKMRIAPNGNVGIGTVTPSQKLHVAGNIMADGSVGVGGAMDTNYRLSVSGGNGVSVYGAGARLSVWGANNEVIHLLNNGDINNTGNILSEGEISTKGTYFVARDASGGNTNKVDINNSAIRILAGGNPVVAMGNNGVIEAGAVNSRGNVMGAYMYSSGNVDAVGSVNSGNARMYATPGAGQTAYFYNSAQNQSNLSFQTNGYVSLNAISGQSVGISNNNVWPPEFAVAANQTTVRGSLDIRRWERSGGNDTYPNYMMRIMAANSSEVIETAQQFPQYNRDSMNVNNLFYLYNPMLSKHARLGVEKIYAYDGISTKHAGIDINFFRTDAGHEHDYIRGFMLYAQPTVADDPNGNYSIELKANRTTPMHPSNTLVVRTRDGLGDLRVANLAVTGSIQGPGMAGSEYSSVSSFNLSGPAGGTTANRNISIDSSVKFLAINAACSVWLNDSSNDYATVTVNFNAGYTRNITACSVAKSENISNGTYQVADTKFIPVPAGATSATITIQRSRQGNGYAVSAEAWAVR